MIKKKVLVLGLTLLSPMLAIGQEEKKEQHDLSEVVVVATRIPEVKQNSASSISIITSKELQEISRFLPECTLSSDTSFRVLLLRVTL